MSKYLITGGAGFIGSHFVEQVLWQGHEVLNLDLLTYAGNPANLSEVQSLSGYRFVKGSICDTELVARLLEEFNPDYVVNFAAETHVDRSLKQASDFVLTNVVGTESLLKATTDWWKRQTETKRNRFRFLQISTDEVFGSLNAEDPAFTEESEYRPNSPYAASKASGDMFVRAYHRSFGLPTLITNCSNNYGSRQYLEKFIPMIITSALQGRKIPVYGNGLNVRDWLFVDDHCDAIAAVLQNGRPGQSYNIGGLNEKTNLEVVDQVCATMDAYCPREDQQSYATQVEFVAERPGHDLRYAIDCSKLQRETGWSPKVGFDSGIRQTVIWYLKNRDWVAGAMDAEFEQWLKNNYEQRKLK